MTAQLGSPPRMRGKLHSLRCVRRCQGITPADAGKTNIHRPDRAVKRDHPRGCGENHSSDRTLSARRGSPPRMRGKPRYNVGIYVGQGITPADAGKTRCWAASRVSLRDHPRGCGENTNPAFQSSIRKGSPPRMRGKLCSLPDWNAPQGITPADAGKTRCYTI